MELYITDCELLHAIKERLDFNSKMINEQQLLRDELKSVNEKLISSEQMKTSFLSNIRNELNNPIASILELSNCMVSEQAEPGDIRNFSAMLQAEAFNLDFQIRNIILSAEIEAGGATLNISAVKMNALVTDTIASYRPLLKKKNISVAYDNQIPAEEFFLTDPEKIHLIIRNLLSNAINFNRESGSIIITTRIADDTFYFSVADSGIGIRPEHISRIFDRFFQAENGTDKSYAGHGLGLTVTKSALEFLRGHIEVISEDGKGSEFRIEVRQATPSAITASHSSAANEFLFGDELMF